MKHGFLFEVGTEFLYIIQISFGLKTLICFHNNFFKVTARK
jgi:hypothetical protein